MRYIIMRKDIVKLNKHQYSHLLSSSDGLIKIIYISNIYKNNM